MATYNNIKKIKIGDNIFNLYDSGNTDEHVHVTARSASQKAYLLGTYTAPTSAYQATKTCAETGVYFDTTAATLVATTFKGALTGTDSGNLTSSSTLDATKLSGTIPTSCYTNTKNTAGSTDTSSKIFLIGATSQAANPQTYSHDTAYVGTDGCLYSGGAKVLTAHQTAVTSLTTTAGVHTTKTSATGAVSMAIPTKTSHLTNDSGFLTSNNVTDYIIEQGTSGIWTYRKWNSGIAECWGSVATTTALTTWVSPISYGSTYCARQTFPTGLFTSVPREFASLSSGTDSWLCSDSTNKVTATQTGRYYIARPSSPSGNFTFTVYFHEIGNWK